MGEFGVALLHVIELGNKTPYRCGAKNTKRFWFASRSRFLGIQQLQKELFGESKHLVITSFVLFKKNAKK